MATRRLRVLQVLPALDGGGVERGTLEVAAALVAAGHHSMVMSEGGGMVPALEQGGSQHLTWPIGRKSIWILGLVPRLRRWLRDHPVDIIHVRSRLPAWIVHFALRNLAAEHRPHLVSTVHGLYSVGRYSAIMCHGERIIAVSHTVEGYLREHYPKLDPGRIRVIPRGIQPEEFPFGYQPDESWLAAWYQQYPALRGRFVLTLPGRITRLKGHHDFLEMLQRLLAAGLPVCGLIVGGEHPRRQRYAAELRKRVQELGLDSHLCFTGQRGDMREIYAASDIVFSLSRKPESFGRTTLEALSIGTPVIGYDHGGVGEILSELFPQGLVPLADIDGLVAHVSAYYQSLPQTPEQHRYLLDDMLTSTLGLYEELMP